MPHKNALVPELVRGRTCSLKREGCLELNALAVGDGVDDHEDVVEHIAKQVESYAKHIVPF